MSVPPNNWNVVAPLGSAATLIPISPVRILCDGRTHRYFRRTAPSQHKLTPLSSARVSSLHFVSVQQLFQKVDRSIFEKKQHSAPFYIIIYIFLFILYHFMYVLHCNTARSVSILLHFLLSMLLYVLLSVLSDLEGGNISGQSIG